MERSQAVIMKLAAKGNGTIFLPREWFVLALQDYKTENPRQKPMPT
jgi:hypothetical protein